MREIVAVFISLIVVGSAAAQCGPNGCSYGGFISNYYQPVQYPQYQIIPTQTVVPTVSKTQPVPLTIQSFSMVGTDCGCDGKCNCPCCPCKANFSMVSK